GVLRGRSHQHAVPAIVLPVHRAVARGRHPVPPRQGRNPFRRGRGLARNSRLRHGASQPAALLRHRSRRLSRLCLGHGPRPHRDAEIRHRRSPAAVRERRALAQSLRLQGPRRPDRGGGIEHVISVPEKYQGLRSFAFGDGPELADELLNLVINGIKTATCSTEDEPNTSTPGERWIVLDGQGTPACVIETTEVTYRRYNKVDAAFAYEEGEGDRNLAYWREAHPIYFRRLGRFSEDMMLMCERFQLVEVFGHHTTALSVPSPLVGEGQGGGWPRRPQAGVSERRRSREKQLRQTMTRAETLLWRYLKAGRMDGVGFRRQTP